MIIVPNDFVPAIKQIIQWHLEAYEPDIMSDTKLKRIFERRSNVNGFCVEESELYPLWSCVSDAVNHIVDCGVTEDKLWKIYEWVTAAREKN